MNRISGATALILCLVASLFVVVVAWFALVSPQRSKADRLDVQITGVQTQLADTERVLSTANRQRTAQAIRAGRRAVPDTPEMSAIVRQLAAAAVSAKVELDTLGPQAPVADVGAQSIPIVVTIKGHYFAIQNFLRLLQKSANVARGRVTGAGRLYSVGSITFAQGGASGAGQATSGVISATLSISAYVNSPASAPVTPMTTTAAATATATGATP